MTTASSQIETYTAEEYLAQEVLSKTRSEYRSGEIVPMTGGTPEHNEINSILNAILRFSLKGQPYSIFIADQRLWIPDRDLYTSPDTMVTLRPPELKPGRKDTVINPILVAEVLSASTRAYDRDEKFSAYRTVPSLQEYLLIDQYKPCIEQYVKQAQGKWLFAEYRGLERQLRLSSVAVDLPLADLYEAIAF
ncbi:MAG: Uma2 family endonuclease [Elainellaceae cyanobacterium]